MASVAYPGFGHEIIGLVATAIGVFSLAFGRTPRETLWGFAAAAALWSIAWGFAGSASGVLTAASEAVVCVVAASLGRRTATWAGMIGITVVFAVGVYRFANLHDFLAPAAASLALYAAAFHRDHAKGFFAWHIGASALLIWFAVLENSDSGTIGAALLFCIAVARLFLVSVGQSWREARAFWRGAVRDG